MNPEENYSPEFFEKLREGARRSARAVIPAVLEYVRPASVIDVGCGTGAWLSAFREAGVEDVWGIDGAYVDVEHLEIPPERFLARDLARPFGMGRRFDLVLSLEVAEHLPPESAEAFVRSLAGLGPVVLFSAAAPYQGGTHHVNERWPAYWASRFEAAGLLPVDCLRLRFWVDEDVEWWYAQNLMFYVDRRELERYPRLAEARRAVPPVPPSLVHPRRFLEWVEWGMGLTTSPDPSGPRAVRPREEAT
jgi:SAM-dependent methyltransferase